MATNKLELQRSVVVVKLGGSCLTSKSLFETLNEQCIDDTCAALVKAWVARPEVDFIVVHGAGSFGHFQVRDYNVTFDTSASSNCCKTRNVLGT